MQRAISPMKKLTLLRIDLAENMLQQGESLGVIADYTGFSSPYHLSLMFKKITGMSTTGLPHETKKRLACLKIEAAKRWHAKFALLRVYLSFY